MEVDYLGYKQTGYYSKLITDYLDEIEQLRPFYNRFPDISSFKEQIDEKQSNFPQKHRQVLHKALKRQYEGFTLSDKTGANITALKNDHCFTVVTGHQLNLFTGPLYFLYKIISTINLCEQLSDAYPKYQFVPVYWMATEDHDFEEINFFNYRGKKIQWNRESAGGVGRLSTEGLEAVYDAFSSVVGNTKRGRELLHLFKQAYLEQENLTDATRYLANELFSDHGLVILDGDDPQLKELMIPYVQKELDENISYQQVNASIERIRKANSSYKVQVNPREINFFYLKDGLRERILGEGETFSINNTDESFTKEEFREILKSHPERFSPNVITRPLYQEVILPNLCYIGGGGEIAYWLELKECFNKQKVSFPILLLRNSALVMTEKLHKKADKLKLDLADLFMNQNSFINKKIREISNINIDFSDQREHLSEQFYAMYDLAKKTDPTFLGAVKAQEVKQLKGLDHLEKRLLKAQKRKLKDQVIRMTDIQNELFPNGSLQERTLNFSELYLEFGDSLIPRLMKDLNPLDLRFTILTY